MAIRPEHTFTAMNFKSGGHCLQGFVEFTNLSDIRTAVTKAQQKMWQNVDNVRLE
jgi:hypothetical protein